MTFSRLQLLLALLFGLAVAGCSPAADEDVPLVLLSTDVAIGLIDTHGGEGSIPVTVNPANKQKWSRSSRVTPQDSDDGFTLAMLLNLEAAGALKVLAVIPTFGNATLPPEMLVARKIAHELKGRSDLLIVPGAAAPAGPNLQPGPRWFDRRTVAIAGPAGSFAASCQNLGVVAMRDALLAAERPVHLFAIGPLTDAACLLHSYPEVAPKIAEIGILASQLQDKGLFINGTVVNDFNFRMDPLGGTMLLAARTTPEVPIRLITFALSGKTSQKDTLIPFNRDTLRGPTPPTPASETSLAWLLAANEPRNEFWSGIFGSSEGPFDQYVAASVLWPELFECRPARAFVQQCPVPAWSADFKPNETPPPYPYNRPDNPCADHGDTYGKYLTEIPAQLQVSSVDDTGPLVRGRTGIDGNLPDLGLSARRVVACTDFATPDSLSRFARLLYEYTW